MHHSGIYTKVREVIDIDTKYYIIGADYPRCSKCMVPVCPWSSEILKQLDPSHRNKFPAVLTTHLALDRKCVTLLKPRTAGNSSSYLQQALEEIHSEEWARWTVDYLTDCELHKKRRALTQLEVVYEQPPPFCTLPLAQWFETAHANEILSHLDELKGVITSTYGSILKLDSTKKITKKLAGGIADTATWMTNIGNEFGQVLNCVLTTGEGASLDDLCQGIVKRYKDAGEPEPTVIYVDRDCCSETGVTPVLSWFRPWKVTVRLDIFHFMRRFTAGLTTEHHPLYGTFCSKLSSCIFKWDKDDISCLKEAKKTMLLKKHGGHVPTEAQILSSITSSELAKHCRRRTRGVKETHALIQGLLDSMWELTDTTGLRLINPESMTHVWEVQQKHLPCIQDPPDVQLYTKLGSGLQKGDKVLDVLRCGRGSSSLESFHRHQCTFIPGWRCNALHTQMYTLEGVSRWNINRAHQAVDMSGTSHSKIYDVRLMSHVNVLSKRVLGNTLLPEFMPPGKPTNERIAVEYLLAQSDRGDLLSPMEHSEITPPEMQDSRCDSRGVPGWEAVDNLAGYLVSLNRTIIALSTNEIAEILRLYSCLHAIDQSPSKYSLKCKKNVLPGPWRASRKRSGSAPGQQAAERCCDDDTSQEPLLAKLVQP
ncbi:Carboxyl-terminal PDZ ligand of neuronal nitric oxide synthase [Labeo rohita]|uniref:Carboxyl-terminal PDZ ligand of neuronal nitric oxide synthase n=1 Tax=Labeo rohita TaxID=84645 RepID=A0A498N836_LABRO|nr:Carboxyl-terminal PDZ ligand of neuronal nitric oxide synthase [Labeo rohita]